MKLTFIYINLKDHKEIIFCKKKNPVLRRFLRYIILQFCPTFEPFEYATIETNYL